MTFTLTIDMDNAAFEKDPRQLTAAIERVVCSMAVGRIRKDGKDGIGVATDSNGNTVGRYQVQP